MFAWGRKQKKNFINLFLPCRYGGIKVELLKRLNKYIFCSNGNENEVFCPQQFLFQHQYLHVPRNLIKMLPLSMTTHHYNSRKKLNYLFWVTFGFFALHILDLEVSIKTCYKEVLNKNCIVRTSHTFNSSAKTSLLK